MALVVLACLAGLGAQAPQDDEAVWRAFMAWFKSAPPTPGNPLAAYAASLQAAGTPEPEIKRQVGVLMRLMMRERSDWVELFYDKVFTRPLTGDPATDGFTTDPSAIVVEAVKGLAPGTALDAGMGQGRNAVYLARQGWKVTGFDLSAEAIKAARANAAEAGVRVEAVKASYADFDFGTAKWDLIVLIVRVGTRGRPGVRRATADVAAPGRTDRVRALHRRSRRARGRPVMHALKPGQLRGLFTASAWIATRNSPTSATGAARDAAGPRGRGEAVGGD